MFFLSWISFLSDVVHCEATWLFVVSEEKLARSESK